MQLFHQCRYVRLNYEAAVCLDHYRMWYLPGFVQVGDVPSLKGLLKYKCIMTVYLFWLWEINKSVHFCIKESGFQCRDCRNRKLVLKYKEADMSSCFSRIQSRKYIIKHHHLLEASVYSLQGVPKLLQWINLWDKILFSQIWHCSYGC